MERWNLKHVSVYIAAIAVVIFSSLVAPAQNEVWNVIQAYQRILFAVPLLFILAAFLAFRISETSIVLIALSFLALSLAHPLMRILTAAHLQESRLPGFDLLFSSEIWFRFFDLLPFFLSISLSLIFLIPEKVGRFSMTLIKTAIALLPFVFIFSPDYFESLLFRDPRYPGMVFQWISIAASFLPLAGPYLYHDRRSGTFSAALTTALILSMMPMMISIEGYLRETSYLFAGMILLHSLYRVYWENSYIDELTGLFNRRALDERLRKLRRGYSLSMVDIDHFKNFNDTYGHDEGDNVLRLVARILHIHFGKSAYRYGGEEFCIVFRKTNVKNAALKMDEARAAIEVHMFSIRQNVKNRKKASRKKTAVGIKKVKLTVSAGIAEPLKSSRDALAVLKNADKALYCAKENGRNRVEISRVRK